MNSLVLTGRLTANCELEYSKSSGKPRLHFTIAELNNRKESQFETLFLDCYCFGKENIVQYLEKGKAITIQGRLISFKYIDKNNIQQKKLQVIVNEIEFMPAQKNENEARNDFNKQSGDTMPPAQEQAKNQTISNNIPKTAGTYTKEGFIPASPDDYNDEDVPF